MILASFRRTERRKPPGEDAHPYPAAYAAPLASTLLNRKTPPK